MGKRFTNEVGGEKTANDHNGGHRNAGRKCPVLKKIEEGRAKLAAKGKKPVQFLREVARSKSLEVNKSRGAKNAEPSSAKKLPNKND